MLLPPMVKVSICCRSREATCFLAPLFVAKIVATSTLACNQNGTRNLKKTAVTSCTTISKTIEKLRLKNGMLLTMNPAEQTGWIIVEAGRMICAQISEMTIAKAVTPLEKRMNIEVNLATLIDADLLPSWSNKSPAKKYTLSKMAPGSMMCANRKNDAM